MKVKKIILAPAKLNIFLKILGKRDDGYHEIISGITLINLFDHIQIEENNETIISYSGTFKPLNGNFSDCIILKTLDFLDIKNKIPLKINIIKNIPVQGGLGSASTNAAALILALEEMNMIENRIPQYYSSLGADIPCFLFKKDCLAQGMGEILNSHLFPKFYFLIIKPNFNNSTKSMYDKLITTESDVILDKSKINYKNVGNDFEKIVLASNKEAKKIMIFLNELDKSIFVRMTGSGSCFYAVFDKKQNAINANKKFKLKFDNIWSFVGENNFNL